MCDLVALKKDVSIVKNERSLLQNYKKHKKKRMRIFVFYDKEKVHARARAERKEKVQARVQAEQKEKKPSQLQLFVIMMLNASLSLLVDATSTVRPARSSVITTVVTRCIFCSLF